jgi:hypothetical protein
MDIPEAQAVQVVVEKVEIALLSATELLIQVVGRVVAMLLVRQMRLAALVVRVL